MGSAASGDRGAGPLRSQLPADVSGFVGRSGELARLAALVRSARLVTVTGPGGIGKTRLALRAAALETASHGGGHFPHGARLVDLSELTHPELLPDAIASCLRLRARDPRGTLAGVLTRLRAARMLLILDTCEHLTGACTRFAARLLREAEGVTILVTSRQPLHMPGERVLRLGPLPVHVPPPDGRRDASPAGPGDAVELFAQRAAAALPGFTITADDLPNVTRICQRLDGIPLAIELSALRVRALPLAVLAEQLDARFCMLSAARRGSVPRHRTLRAAVAWSYRLCAPAERAVWDRLSVIPGSFGLAAAGAAADRAGVPAGQVEHVLAGLADKSVLMPAGGDWYRLLSPVREYAAERLAQARLEATGCDWRRPAGRQGTRLRPDPVEPGHDARAGGADAGGGAGLTRREREIAALVASGMSNRQIADSLMISRRTVDAHINHIFSKLGLSSRVQLTLWVHEQGRVPRPRAGESASEMSIIGPMK